jgi:hypothetical protein
MITSDRGFIIATPTKCGTTTLEEMCRRHRGGRAQPGLPSFRIMDWEQPRRQHRMALPEREEHDGLVGSWGDADRFLMVRSPMARYVSMYEYLRAPHNYSKFGAREIQGDEWRGREMGRVSRAGKPLTFERFLHFIADARVWYSDRRWSKRRGDLTDPFAYRSPWVWLDSLADSAHHLAAQPGSGAVRLIWLEHFWPSMAQLKHDYGLISLSVKPSIQANKTLTYKGTVHDYWRGVGKSARREIGLEDEEEALFALPRLFG